VPPVWAAQFYRNFTPKRLWNRTNLHRIKADATHVPKRRPGKPRSRGGRPGFHGEHRSATSRSSASNHATPVAFRIARRSWDQALGGLPAGRKGRTGGVLALRNSRRMWLRTDCGPRRATGNGWFGRPEAGHLRAATEMWGCGNTGAGLKRRLIGSFSAGPLARHPSFQVAGIRCAGDVGT
jgi:hypothetical protein